MRKKRGPLWQRNHIGEPKCSWTRLLDSAQPSIFFHAALKQVPPTEFLEYLITYKSKGLDFFNFYIRNAIHLYEYILIT